MPKLCNQFRNEITMYSKKSAAVGVGYRDE